jgi:hypothetical protein
MKDKVEGNSTVHFAADDGSICTYIHIYIYIYNDSKYDNNNILKDSSL